MKVINNKTRKKIKINNNSKIIGDAKIIMLNRLTIIINNKTIINGDNKKLVLSLNNKKIIQKFKINDIKQEIEGETLTLSEINPVANFINPEADYPDDKLREVVANDLLQIVINELVKEG